MRAVGIVAALGGAVAIAACLDAGMRPSSGHPRAHASTTAGAGPKTAATPATGSAPTPPTSDPPDDDSVALTPAVATVDPPAQPDTPPAPPPPIAVEHTSPNGVPESCTLLPKFPFTPPDVDADPKTLRWYHDDDFKDVEHLCQIDLYIDEAKDDQQMVGVCPKLHWSTPALELYDLTDYKQGKQKFQDARCGRWGKRGYPKIAKWKPYVYRKEPESALFYFHFSRLLGNAALVYPATWRTVDRKTFMTWTRNALDYISRLTTTATPINGWSALRQRHKKASHDPDVMFGSLAKNPRGESSHSRFITWQIPQIRTKGYWKMLASKKPIADQLAFDTSDPEDYYDDVQELTYAADFTNLIVLDALFNQRDRAGNINSKQFVHYIDDAGHMRWEKELDPTDTRVAVKLERLILKDNDDGMVWDLWGKMNSSKLVPDLRHLDSVMFARIEWLANLMRDDATADQVKSFFVDQVHVGADSYDEVRTRFLKMADRFQQAFDMGKLKLDLDLEPVIAKAPVLPPDAGKKHHKKKAADKSAGE